ncbi:MAG: CAP domain-containing protein [Leptothrix sp. (in: b-proteobacteria)]
MRLRAALPMTLATLALTSACALRPSRAQFDAQPERVAAQPARCADPGPMLTVQRELLSELNRARTRPADFVPLIEAHFATLDRDNVFIEDGRRIRMHEGRAAIDQAIAYLRTARPVPPLRLSGCLSRAAADHVQAQGPTGHVGHVGEDGSQPSDRATRRLTGRAYCGENITYSATTQARDLVIQLLVDDGVPDRGHLRNIYKADYKTVGFAVGPHARFKGMSVQLMCTNELDAASER